VRWRNISAEELRALGERFLERTRIQRKTSRPLFIDKMPNNFAHTGLIHLILPHAKIIDARATPWAAASRVSSSTSRAGQTFSYDLDELGHYYRDYVELMAHFDAVLPGRVHRVFYEDMVDDTEGEVRRLLAIAVCLRDGVLKFHENQRAVRTASSEQVRRRFSAKVSTNGGTSSPGSTRSRRHSGDVLDRYPATPLF
jgi:hypothetical protein